MLVAVVAIVIVFGLPRFPRQEHVAQRSQASPAPSPWNSGAIQSTFAGAQVQETDATHATLEFFYDLENNTDADYRFAKEPRHGGDDAVEVQRQPELGRTD